LNFSDIARDRDTERNSFVYDFDGFFQKLIQFLSRSTFEFATGCRKIDHVTAPTGREDRGPFLFKFPSLRRNEGVPSDSEDAACTLTFIEICFQHETLD
jgi:hypothetical protein